MRAGAEEASAPLAWPLRSLAIGLLQGPCELLPVSSSAHLTLVPWLLDVDDGWEAPVRKAVEVAAHAGTVAVLLFGPGGTGAGPAPLERGRADLSQRLLRLLAATAPPALTGLLLEGPIERRLGAPGWVSAGLLGGSVGMVLADRRPQERGEAQAGLLDALWLGAAQSAALWPGVSRSGATLAALRWRRFTRTAAFDLSWQAGLPVMAGAAGLKTVRLAQRGMAGREVGAAALAAGGAALSTTAAARLLGGRQRGRRLLGFALYRCLLGALVLLRLRTQCAGSPPPGGEPVLTPPEAAE